MPSRPPPPPPPPAAPASSPAKRLVALVGTVTLLVTLGALGFAGFTALQDLDRLKPLPPRGANPPGFRCVNVGRGLRVQGEKRSLVIGAEDLVLVNGGSDKDVRSVFCLFSCVCVADASQWR